MKRTRLQGFGFALVLALAFAPVRAARAGDEATVQAKTHFLLGQAAYEEGHYDEAYAEYEAGYKLVPKPAFLLNMAQAERQRGKLKHARELYKKFLAADPQSTQRAAVVEILADIDARLAAAPAGAAGAPVVPTPPLPPAPPKGTAPTGTGKGASAAGVAKAPAPPVDSAGAKAPPYAPPPYAPPPVATQAAPAPALRTSPPPIATQAAPAPAPYAPPPVAAQAAPAPPPPVRRTPARPSPTPPVAVAPPPAAVQPEPEPSAPEPAAGQAQASRDDVEQPPDLRAMDDGTRPGRGVDLTRKAAGPARDDDGAFYTRGWFWGLVGIVVTGAVVGGVLVAGKKSPAEPFHAAGSWGSLRH